MKDLLEIIFYFLIIMFFSAIGGFCITLVVLLVGYIITLGGLL